jgi:hypothetical protein
VCGPTLQEKALQQQSANFSSMLQQNYGTMFSKQLDVLNSIGKSLSPILAAGPNQHGFSADELAARNTQAINSAGAANRAAQQAARTYGAGQGGGGTSGVTSGITKQIESAIGTQSAQTLGTNQGNIVGEDFATGRRNYEMALGGEQALAGQFGSGASSSQSGAITSNQNSFGQAKTIEEQQAQKAQMIAGGITSLAGFAAGGIGNLDMQGTSSIGEQIGNFFGA